MAKSAGEGERSAASGYFNQYQVSAGLIIKSLKSEDLDWIRLADPEAGQIDDLQIASTSRVDAYQIKWSQYPGTITLNDLIKNDGDSTSLINQLAQGWEKLSEKYPNRRTVVHLYTNKVSSSSTGATLPDVDNKPQPYHFSAFIEQAWNPRNFTTDNGSWDKVWESLRENTGFSKQKFSEFIGDCCLEFNKQSPAKDEDHNNLANELFRLVADSQKKIHVDRKELISRFGWQNRYEFRNRHEFNVPNFYKQIKSTVKKLTETLNSLPGGYVGLKGGPGSGKSTLLTKTLRNLPHRLIRYYAYVPDAQDPSVRGESENFLHDITLSLKRAGFGKSITQPKNNDRISLLELFQQQLYELGKRYKNENRKSIILVDGLDHISREQNPQRSLLKDLPNPSQIPEGVYFVVGSQTFELPNISTKVKKSIQQENRLVKIDRLSPSDVADIASSFISNLEEQQSRKIFKLSSGHPLALTYLLKQINDSQGRQGIQEILSSSASYDEDIDNFYWSHWDKVEGNEDLIEALGLICRVRGSINMNWVSEWIDDSEARRIEKMFSQYFKIEAGNRWYFFHNSFRLFLQEQTSQPYLGQKKEKKEVKYHRSLAAKYLNSDLDVKQEAIYHLFKAEEYKELINLASGEWFYNQVSNLRPLNAIDGDVKLAIKAAGQIGDRLSLLKFMMVSASITQREYIISDKLISEKLLEIGDISKAIDHIRDGDSLRVDFEEALYLARKLNEKGVYTEADRLFELSEPYELFVASLDPRDTQYQEVNSLLSEWARSAPLFREVNEVLYSIDRAAIEKPFRQDENWESKIRKHLKICAAETSAKYRMWDYWDCIVKNTKDSKFPGLFRLYVNSIYAADSLRKRTELINDLAKKFEPISIEDDRLHRIKDRIDVAELFYFEINHSEVAKKWIEDIDFFPIQTGKTYTETKIDIHSLRFRLYRLKFLLGDSRNPRAIISKEEEKTNFPSFSEDQESTYYRSVALMLTSLAQQWSQAYRDNTGNTITPSYFYRENKWLLDFLNSLSSISVTLRHRLKLAKTNIIKFLMLTAHQFGGEVVHFLSKRITNIWHEDGWYTSDRRKVINVLSKLGYDNLASDLLEKITKEQPHYNNIWERVDEYWENANAWLLLKNYEKARGLLCRMVDESRGLLDDNDYQSEIWVRWMGYMNEADPENSAERIYDMYCKLLSVEGDASGITDAINKLVLETFKFSPQKAIDLVLKLYQQKASRFEYLINNLLKGAIKSDDEEVLNIIIQYISRLLIPLTDSNISGLMVSLLQKIEERHGKIEAVKTAKFLVERIKSDGMPNNQSAYLDAVSDALQEIDYAPSKVGISKNDLKTSKDNPSSGVDRRTLKAKDNTEIKIEEAFEIASTPEGLKKLYSLNDPDRDDYFDWGEVVNQLIETTDNQRGLKSIYDLVIEQFSQREASLLLIELSKRANILEESELAEKYAKSALEKSEAMGWDKWMRGGTRIKALEALQDINPQIGYKKAVQLFSEDVGGSFVSTSRLINYFDDILGVLFKEIPVKDIWSLIEDYLHELYKSVDINEDSELRTKLKVQKKEDTATKALSNLLLLYFDYPSYVVSSQAMKACSSILNSDSSNESLEKVFESSSELSDLQKERVLVVLDSISYKSPNKLKRYQEFIESLLDSPNINIRLEASILKSRLEAERTRLKIVDKELPNIYSLELPEISSYNTLDEWDDNGSAFVIGDPARMIRPFDIEVRQIADETGLSEDALIYRTVRYFKKYYNENDTIFLEGNSPEEKEVLNYLRYMGPQVTYHKPHIEPARQAVFYALSELWDSQAIRAIDLKHILLRFQNKEPRLLINESRAIPEWVDSKMGLSNSDNLYSIPDNWLNNIEINKNSFEDELPGDKILLGEFSRLARIGLDDRIEEDRISMYSSSKQEELQKNEAIEKEGLPFCTYSNIKMEAYMQLSPPLNELIIARSSYSEIPGGNWLAFNPQIAKDFGWTFKDSGNFRWVDKNGSMAVESIWWNHGYLERHDQATNSKLGRGWSVIVSLSAFKALEERYNSINKLGIIRRRIGFNGKKGRSQEYSLLK